MPSSLTGRLENWVYDKTWNIVWGNVYDDVKDRFYGGQWIHTSDIPGQRGKEPLKKGDVIETMNSTYLLGKKGKSNE